MFPGTIHNDQRSEVGDANPTQLLEISLMALAPALLPTHFIQSAVADRQLVCPVTLGLHQTSVPVAAAKADGES